MIDKENTVLSLANNKGDIQRQSLACIFNDAAAMQKVALIVMDQVF